tara:strand:- start:26542 stop:26871 length:330 start_codon:yes stop_codon:yes gene_type:complete
MRLDELVKLIIATNHSWKRQRDLWGADSSVARMLQGRKSSLQTQLLTVFSSDTYLKLDLENDEGEPLYSVRLKQALVINNTIRHDAEHLPVRIAEELLTQEQITQRLEL